jgi:galactokinase/mevalonate kinase-like predicted kinase
MAVFGGLNYMDFRGKESLEQSDSEPFATVEPLADHVSVMPFVAAHTGIKRNSGQVHKSLRQRWLEGEPDVVSGYIEAAELARDGKKALIEERWQELGKLMDENHGIQRRLGASGEVNDRLIDAARKNGALGAKLAGAGHGGTIIALTLDPDTTVGALRAAGAQRILIPRPANGLVVERVDETAIGLGELAIADHK